MIWAIIILSIVVIVGVYLYGKHRGKVDNIHDTLDEQKEQDKKEAQDDLDKKNESDAWDNLDDTINDLSNRD